MKKSELRKLIKEIILNEAYYNDKIHGLVLTFGWYVKDDWYGQRYRVILSKTPTEGFANKKEMTPYISKFTKYVKSKYKPTSKNIEIGYTKDFVNYRYVSMGPAFAENQYFITVNDLPTNESKINEEKRYKEVELLLPNNKKVTITGMAFQKRSVPDPHTSQYDILRALALMGYKVNSYKVLSLKESKINEATKIDLMYIKKAMVEYQRNHDFNKMVDSISVDLRIQRDKKKLDKLKEHLGIVFSDNKHFNDKELNGLANEILNNFQ